jgi:hypothetical protein
VPAKEGKDGLKDGYSFFRILFFSWELIAKVDTESVGRNFALRRAVG